MDITKQSSCRSIWESREEVRISGVRPIHTGVTGDRQTAEVTEDSPWHVELVVELHGLDGAFVEGRVVLEVLPVDRLGRVVPPLILHNESVRILAMVGLDIPSVPPIVSFFETWLPP